MSVTDDFSGTLSKWTQAPGVYDGFTISSGTIVPDAVAAWNGMYYSDSSFNADQSAQITVSNVTGVDAGPVVRCITSGGALNFYWGEYLYGSSACRIVKLVNGSQTNLVTYDSITCSNGDTLKISITGTNPGSITMYRNDVALGVAIEDSDLDSGSAGIVSYSNGGAFDNFVATGEVTAGSPSSSPSASPSNSASASPSGSPSNSPSASPSNSPSASPSGSPSNSASTSPSNSPSNSPSTSPSNSPSNSTSPSPGPYYETTIAWDASVGATGYNVYAGTSTGTYTFHYNVYNNTQVDLSLPAGTWYVAVTAYNGEGESTYSNEINFLVSSHSPSSSASASPSNSPSPSPSGSPSNSASASPSNSPSSSPSSSPSGSPSNSPSTSPSSPPHSFGPKIVVVVGHRRHH